MPNKFEKKCEICMRSHNDPKWLGPFLEINSIAAHYNCVIFNPEKPTQVDLDPTNPIGGVTTRYIRTEGKRAKSLVIIFNESDFFRSIIFHLFLSLINQICVYCKRGGANAGCCRRITNMPTYCTRSYHVDCALKKNASFTYSGNCGTVSLCFEHRDTVER